MSSKLSAALAAVLLLVCYTAAIRGMADQWYTDEDMGHGFLVPLVIAWIVWRERERWQAIPAAPTLWGVPFLAAGAALHLSGALGVGLFAGALGLLVSTFGVVLCFHGVQRTRTWIFPLLLSLFMLPKLNIVYNQVTLPLQLVATKQAAGILWAAGIGVVREGNILQVGTHRVAVVEACSGLRYLIPLGFAAVVFAYLADTRPWMRFALLLASVPVAIFANACRVAATAWLPALSEPAFHSFAGWLLFVACMAAIWAVHRLLPGRVHA